MPTIKSVRASEVPRVGQRRAFDHRTAETAAWHDMLVSLDAADWQVKLLEGDPAGAECVETTRMPF
jgi:hypothetical protein